MTNRILTIAFLKAWSIEFTLLNFSLNKTRVSDTDASFLHARLSDVFVTTKIYGKRDYFEFDIVNFPFFSGTHATPGEKNKPDVSLFVTKKSV